MPHFVRHSKNVSAERLASCSAEYDRVALTPYAGKLKITKSNIMTLSYSFLHTSLQATVPTTAQPNPPLPMPTIFRTVLWMHQSGGYLFGPQWAFPSGYRLLSARHAQAYWVLVNQPQQATIESIARVMCEWCRSRCPGTQSSSRPAPSRRRLRSTVWRAGISVTVRSRFGTSCVSSSGGGGRRCGTLLPVF